MDHPGDNQRARDAPFAALDAQVVEDVGEAEIVEGLEAQALAADRARGLVLQGIEVDGGGFGLARLFLHRLDAEPPGPEPGDDVLGCGLHVRRGCEQRRAAVEQRLGALSNFAPFLLRHRIVGAEVEERALPDLVADALREHEAMTADGLAVGGVGFGCPDEHVARREIVARGQDLSSWGLGSRGNRQYLEFTGTTMRLQDGNHKYRSAASTPSLYLVCQPEESDQVGPDKPEKVLTWVQLSTQGRHEGALHAHPTETALPKPRHHRCVRRPHNATAVSRIARPTIRRTDRPIRGQRAVKARFARSIT